MNKFLHLILPRLATYAMLIFVGFMLHAIMENDARSYPLPEPPPWPPQSIDAKEFVETVTDKVEGVSGASLYSDGFSRSCTVFVKWDADDCVESRVKAYAWDTKADAVIVIKRQSKDEYIEELRDIVIRSMSKQTDLTREECEARSKLEMLCPEEPINEQD